MLAGGLLATLALVLAGCTGTGNFDVQQTEPFRVQLEGEPQTVVVSEDDTDGKEVLVETCDDPCDEGDAPQQVQVKVQVTPRQAEACIVKITIKDRDTGEVLDEREVDTGGSGGASTETDTVTQTQTETQTVTETQTQASGDGGVTIENIVVDVRGGHNIVVVTQAIQGTADVDISAVKASGNADVDVDQGDSGSTATMTGSATMTTTASTNTTTGNTTGSPP